LIGHQDVVPADDTQKPWKQPPFSGVIVDGELWGRGTLDDKINVIGLLEAVEHLSAEGFQPRRTVYLAFGQDEEVNGEGALAIASLLKSRGAKVDFLLDEGSFVTEAMLPGIQKAVAAVAIAEKGYLDLEMSVSSAGGHSSAPPPHTAVGILGRAITRLENNPLPSRVDGAMEQTFAYAGPEMSFPLRAVAANEWLTRGILRKALETSPTTNAEIRTTAAVNQVFGSDTSNALPEVARAVVNFRLLPGDRIEDVVAHVKKVVDDPQVQLKVLVGNNAPPLADIESASGRMLQRTLRQIYPETVFAPILSPGATDARNYEGLTQNLFRFIPVTVNDDALTLIHGRNERVAVKELGTAVQFYEQLMVNLASEPKS
jgi:carboxypeptidase PM20D1